ncbi:uncharacterized protein MEPE_05830 [Melanopsichium pennsylvanicum]|uniref:Uncharacterized protein n=1 Tax=Melanopsichium pennsylvanicum TaxID=63383 RepID=A0AAJ5C7P6_9BASI|nr:uncharacterized protein MEPE_05830 [Melanopsichium pennsylvanicum]
MCAVQIRYRTGIFEVRRSCSASVRQAYSNLYFPYDSEYCGISLLLEKRYSCCWLITASRFGFLNLQVYAQASITTVTVIYCIVELAAFSSLSQSCASANTHSQARLATLSISRIYLLVHINFLALARRPNIVSHSNANVSNTV